MSCLHLVTSCSNNPSKYDEQYLSAGDSIKLIRPITVRDLRSHVIFQDGEIINEDDLAPYRTSCIFEAHKLGSKTYQSEILTLNKIDYYEEMYSDGGAVVRYFTEFYLASNDHKDGFILTCQVLDDTMQYHSFPSDEIKQATGNYFNF